MYTYTHKETSKKKITITNNDRTALKWIDLYYNHLIALPELHTGLLKIYKNMRVAVERLCNLEEFYHACYKRTLN